MSGRRSRLQVKPNIGGVKAGASARPAKKDEPPKPNTDAIGSATRSRKPSTSEPVLSPTRSRRPSASEPHLSPTKSRRISSSEVVGSPVHSRKTSTSESVCSPTKVLPTSPLGSPARLRKPSTSELKESEKLKASVDFQQIEQTKDTSSNNDADVSKKTENVENTVKKDSTTTGPARARLRKFGTVNIGAARGCAPKLNDRPKVNEKEDLALKDKTSDSNTEKDNESTQEKSDEPKNEEKASENVTPATRRARLPKAKPNLLDASKRRNKPVEEAESKEKTSPPSEVPDEEPFIPPPSRELAKGDDSDTNDGSETNGVTMTQIQSRPPLPRSPIKLPGSVGSGCPFLSPQKPLGPGEKRNRTISTSEPVVNRRVKKPKLVAPLDQPPDRSTMKMRDLIWWNPSSNPMKPKQKPTTPVRAVEKENIDRATPIRETIRETTPVREEQSGDTSLPVPQVTIGPDGSIVINEQSLVVAMEDKDKGSPDDMETVDETDTFTTYSSFRNRRRAKRWTNKETVKFYKALGMLGIDFFLITQLFPNRTRTEVKKKFKAEEKKNKLLIEKILSEKLTLDPTVFDRVGDDSSAEEEEVEELKKRGDKGEKKKGTKAPKAEGKKSTEIKAEKKTRPASKRKRSKKLVNYYEDTPSEDEDEEEAGKQNKARETNSMKTTSVSQTDGEVVSILMDMSEGRLTTIDKVMSPSATIGQPIKYSEEKVPLPSIENLVQDRKTPLLFDYTPSPTNVQNYTQFNSMNCMESLLPNSLYSPLVPLPSASMDSSTCSVMPQISQGRSLLNTSSAMLRQSFTSALMSGQTAGNEEIPFMSPRTADSFTSGSFNEAEMQIMSPQTAREKTTAYGINAPVDDNSQYVLVTVVPEDGGETVIHIYRLHSNAQSTSQLSASIGNAPESEASAEKETVNPAEGSKQIVTEPTVLADSEAVTFKPVTSEKVAVNILTSVTSEIV